MTQTLVEAGAPAGDDAASAGGQGAKSDVYAVFGADPEVLAYAMAKYSRSSLTMRESLEEISASRAEQFLNTFYFQYGHRSIADLAHVAFAIERLSLLAAIAVVDEPRWDGQERSTRYQDFRKSGWYTPDFSAPGRAADETGDIAASTAREKYATAIRGLFEAYDRVSGGMLDALKEQVPRPAEMKEEAYTRTLKARAFDVARYLLPLATNTSLGQIVNARTLEQQISRLLTSSYGEIRNLGQQLRKAAAGAAWNAQEKALRELQQEVAAHDALLGDRLERLMLREVKTAPTLVKYTAANDYAEATRRELGQMAGELMHGKAIEAAPVVDLLETEPLEIELATTLLYGVCDYSYRQLRREVEAMTGAMRAEIIALGTRHRGRYDELARGFSSGYAFRFDILMDIGGFRDMHRHRRCIQVLQGFTAAHGYEVPEGIAAGLQATYEEAVSKAFLANAEIAASGIVEAGETAKYLLPLGTRTRALFKMDFAEALYISELRSGMAGHFSYRRVAWEMYQCVRRSYPELAKHFRVTDIHAPVDLLKR